MFKVRNLIDSDYDNFLVGWWKQWRWTPPPRDFLPQNGTGGVMVEKEGIPIVAGFVYLTNSAVAWSEFIISNFEYKEPDRKQAIKIIIQELSEISRQCGAKYIYTVVKNPSLQKMYEEMGFTNGSQKANEMFLIL
ncbi:hypothetical protein [Flavobacterium sp.]|uniref:hypothetical protein n=1 Tax=Flavobacterium sp. TaxID=239 RepID=UPI003D6C2AC7